MSPEPGHRTVRHAGDAITFRLVSEGPVPSGWTARLRTNLGRADRVREEIVASHFQRLPLAGAAWRDLPMVPGPEGWSLTLPLTEVGFFKAKAYALDERGFQHWPGGPDVGISIHPSWTRTANTIYCAFPRMFGPWSKARVSTRAAHHTPGLQALDEAGFTVIPPSGTLRDLQRELPHIIERLGCRILHLLPVSPTPTTFARMGRFGSPYALQDLTGIDPALVEFDRRTNGVDQFRELAYATHTHGARLFLDLVINHTGWGSTEWQNHPEWFVRKPDGEFECPGAWDVVWEDLVELDQRHVALWDYLAEAFLTWCRRGVDGFRCDAGYKIPPHVWQFITARVRQEFPDTVFLLEGLGGPWEATDACLAEGGMQWAYSELFQNFGAASLGGYLDHHLRASAYAGTLVHYSETHDNSRLAATGGRPGEPVTAAGVAWSRHRNRLCALLSLNGGFGFTCGVEWCATEQINVHSSRGLSWGQSPNLVTELAALNRLLAGHPCFFDGAHLTRLSTPGDAVIQLKRDSADGLDSVLVLVNTQADEPASCTVEAIAWRDLGQPAFDLLRSGDMAEPSDWTIESLPVPTPKPDAAEPQPVTLRLGPGAVVCLSATPVPRGLSGEAYRTARAQADWGRAMCARVTTDAAGPCAEGPWRDLAAEVAGDPAGFLARTLQPGATYRPVIEWHRADVRKVTCVPPGHWLLVWDATPFRARLAGGGAHPENVASLAVRDGFIAAFAPRELAAEATLELERYTPTDRQLTATIRFLAPRPESLRPPAETLRQGLVLLTNDRGGMARLGIDLGRIVSKYDCLLGANLHPRVPSDRHVFAKRARVWVDADGFITPLNADNLLDFEPGPPAHWRFLASAGDGRSVEIHLVADMLEGSNTVLLQFSRPVRTHTDSRLGRPLPPEARVRLTVRVDIEDRNFHWETRRNSGSEHHFATHCRGLTLEHTGTASGSNGARVGFEFTPAADRVLRVFTHSGVFHHQPEWTENVPHPVEASRGMTGQGDAYSPGWFDLPVASNDAVTLVVTAEPKDPPADAPETFVAARQQRQSASAAQAAKPLPGLGAGAPDAFAVALVQAAQAFVVRRDDTRTVIAGYPWFLDWGRDSLIAARGLLAAGMLAEVRQLLVTFARFEQDGTLPNSIFGENASNRDTSDAPLWFGVVAEELAAMEPGASGPDSSTLYGTVVDQRGRTVADVLRAIACGHLAGAPNGVAVDHASGLVWSPSHFTWMDTNHPAGTPREGYPVEIQVLWIRLLRQLARLGAAPWDGRGESWADLARRTEKSFHSFFWLEEKGWLADCLRAARGHPARSSPQDDALRSNGLLAVALDLLSGERARRLVSAAQRHLVIPGALRSLAPLMVTPPLPVWHNGQLLNDPDHPYWGRYEGDEDTRRKAAYHNGTAWVWTFPAFCEALVKAHDHDPAAIRAARAFLGSADRLWMEGCVGQLPEIIDGDAPHTQRGCDAQAWSVTEVLRVWRWLDATDT
jgi:starch synthase (maltosyl-transferring)